VGGIEAMFGNRRGPNRRLSNNENVIIRNRASCCFASRMQAPDSRETREENGSG
jgi:hypothetical protein